MDLQTFVGNWRDSRGNHVRVDWARPGNRGGQLDVSLSRSGREPIRLNIKRLSSGNFTCGHYDLEEEDSSRNRIVWQDTKNRRNYSTWEREASDGDRDDPEHWCHRKRQRDDSRSERRDGRHRGGRRGGRSCDRDSGHDRDRRDSRSRSRNGRERSGRNGSHRREDVPAVAMDEPPPPPRGPPPGVAGPPGPWGCYGWGAPPWGPCGFGCWPWPPPEVPPPSVWSGAPTPGAWVPPSAGPLPGSETSPGACAAATPPEGSWRSAIEEMYRRFNPSKLAELESIMAKYRGKEADLYNALRGKYLPGAPGPGMQPLALPALHESPALQSIPAKAMPKPGPPGPPGPPPGPPPGSSP